MKFTQILTIIFLTVLFALLLNSCSNGKSPVEPLIENSPEMSQDIPDSLGIEDSSRNVLSVYECVIDPDAKTFTAEPINRSVDYHYPLTNLYPNVLQITSFGWTPNFWADIKLTHPLLGSGIDAFDPRVIAILPANPGVRFIYPVMGVGGNNAVVLEPDGYTKLFDELGGTILGNVNPFRAYFKDQPYRRWSSTGATTETQRWQMDIAGFGGPLQFKLVVDVSTNYPNPPQPVIDNAPEPVRITMRMGNDLTPDGGSTTIEVTLLDWQGQATIGGVAVESPSIFNGVVSLPYSHTGPYPNEYIYSGTISNSKLAPEGEYQLLVASWDSGTNITIYNEFPVMVQETIEFNPVDVTPRQLVFEANDVFISGSYAYIAAGEYGLLIFDISNPLNPIYVNMVDTTGYAESVYVSGGYAYVTDYFSGLQIIDIEPPESAYIVKSVDTPGAAYGCYVAGGYAYVADETSGLQIIDIEPPESAYIVKGVNTPGYALGVYVSGGYAYVADETSGLQIIDIEPPESAYIVKNVDTPGYAYGVYVSGGYAYVADGTSGLQIIDIEPPESAYIVKTVDTPDYARGVYVSSGYAYVADYDSGLQIIDIAIPSMAYIVKTVDTPWSAVGVYVSGNYAYVADVQSGLQIIDIEWPGLAYIAKSIETTSGAYAVDVSGDYSYVANANYGLQMIFEPLESAHIINSIKPGGSVWMGSGNSFCVSSGYAYFLGTVNFNIIDIEPPESAYNVKSIDMQRSARGVYVSGGYAYVADGSYGLQIIDIEPPESAYIVKSVDTPASARGVYVSGGYAYVADGPSGLQIIDILPPRSAYIVTSFATPGYAGGVYVSGGYAYVAAHSGGLRIIKLW